jgi:antitoxin VapB
MLTRIFKSGNSLAVRIPKELAIVDSAQDVEIERVGNTLVVRPVAQQTLGGIGEVFALFSSDFMAGGREFNEEYERDWGGSCIAESKE